ncbi:MAG: two-component system response regulator NreC [Cyclobacteriaceae bacterium]|jgi:two-component system response regulator NreC
MKKISIAIIDDHQLFREGLLSLLSAAEDDYCLIGSFNSGILFFEFLEQNVLPDILLLDINMPEMDGFSVIQKIKKRKLKMKIIVLSMHDDGSYILKAARNGADGYLLKNVDAAELRQAIFKVYDGVKYFSSEVSSRMFDILSLEGIMPSKLTPKENEVLQLISKGLTTKEIAVKLFVSSRTIETHRLNMMKKLSVKNSAELISTAMKLNLIK